MKIGILFLFAAIATAQTPATSSGMSVEPYGFYLSDAPQSTMNAHDYAMQTIKEWCSYQSKGIKTDTKTTALTVEFNFATAKPPLLQTAIVDCDGNIDLSNISEHDVMLLLLANSLSEELRQMEVWDAQRKAEEQAKKSIPPSPIKVKGTIYVINNLPDWSNGTLLGDTTCDLHRVRVLDKDPDKKTTVMHEMMHVVTGCNNDPRLHALITELAPGLVKLLQDNPDLVKYLTTKSIATQEKTK